MFTLLRSQTISLTCARLLRHASNPLESRSTPRSSRRQPQPREALRPSRQTCPPPHQLPRACPPPWRASASVLRRHHLPTIVASHCRHHHQRPTPRQLSGHQRKRWAPRSADRRDDRHVGGAGRVAGDVDGGAQPVETEVVDPAALVTGQDVRAGRGVRPEDGNCNISLT